METSWKRSRFEKPLNLKTELETWNHLKKSNIVFCPNDPVFQELYTTHNHSKYNLSKVIISISMTLDFHSIKDKKYLFRLEDSQIALLSEIFQIFRLRSGLYIDPYGDVKLSPELQRLLLQIIDEYVAATDLNANKEKTSAILEFKGLIRYFTAKKTDLLIVGD